MTSTVATSLWARRNSISSCEVTCSTCTRLPSSRARLTRRVVAVSAAISSRQTGWEEASPSTRRCRRSSRRGSCSQWKEARRRITLRMARTPGSSATSSEPVEEPMNTLMPAAPGSISSSGRSLTLSWVPPTKKAKSQCMRPVARAILSSSALAEVVSGLVFGISNTAVTPPMTAARDPDSRSSLCSMPGSRKCTWVSMTPGRRCRPVQSTVSSARSGEKEPMPAMRPARMPTSRAPMPSWFTTVPPLSRRSKVSVMMMSSPMVTCGWCVRARSYAISRASGTPAAPGPGVRRARVRRARGTGRAGSPPAFPWRSPPAPCPSAAW